MTAYRLSPQERATLYARKVDRLFVRSRDYFLSRVETYKQAAREKHEREKDAEQPHFDAPVPPGCIEVEDWRPGLDLTPALMATLLAALHDKCLPDSPPILGLDCDTADGALQICQDPGLLALLGARVWCGCAMQGDTDRLDALETYLSRATADIEAIEAAGVVRAARAERMRKGKTGGKENAAAPRPTAVDRAAALIVKVFQDRPDTEKRKYLKAATVLVAVKEKNPAYDRKIGTIRRALTTLVEADVLESKTNAGFRPRQE